MLVRLIAPTSRRILLPSRQKLSWRLQCRQCSSSASVASASTPGNIPILAGIKSELDRIAPRIDIRADQIEVLDGPAQFYETLKKKIRGAKRRIYISTLYIGKSEHELISSLRDALLHNGHEFKVSILVDALRGTRESPDPSCASLLAALAAEFPDRVEVRMYHTPNLTGIRKRLIPKRINEGWGLQHIKLYGFDDEVILSGANLSSDYFTNRQDRYHIFSSKRVTDYFARIHNAICSVSFLLLPDGHTEGEEKWTLRQQDGGSEVDAPPAKQDDASNSASYTLTWPRSNPAPSPLRNPHAYIAATTALILPLTSPGPPLTPSSSSTTSIYPLLTHPPTINTELPALLTILSSPLRSYTFTAGYFNPHPLITSSLLSSSRPPQNTPGTVLTASPLANGFYNSPGISGLLPAAYSHLSLLFLRASNGANIQLREWQRGVVGEEGGWTYHAKGLWVTLQLSSPDTSNSAVNAKSKLPNPLPNITSIGSSNYTTRSYSLDLEVSALVVTGDESLMRKWERERTALLERSQVVSEEELASEKRRVGWKVKVAMWIVRTVGGAL